MTLKTKKSLACAYWADIARLLVAGSGAFIGGNALALAPASDLIISVAEPNQCLRVQEPIRVGSLIGVASCDANERGQNWVFQSNTIRLYDSQLCLAASALDEGKRLVLKKCDNGALQQWAYAKQSFRIAQFAIDLSKVNEPLDVYSYHGEANQRWQLLSEIKQKTSQSDQVKVKYPISVKNTKLLALEQARDLINRLTPTTQALPYPRDVSAFPGLIAADAPSTSASFTLNRRSEAFKHIGWQFDWYTTLHTGLWAPAGKVIKVKTIGATAADLSDVSVQINEQVDVLNTDGSLVNDDSYLRRYANVSMAFPLKVGAAEIRSQYGGFIQINSKKYANTSVYIEIADAIAAPYFNTQTHTLADWPAILKRPGPWVRIEGRRSAITVPRDQAKNLKDPVALMSYYDNHIENIEWLAGFDGSGPLHPKQVLKQHLAWSPQIVAGYGHAGYPIMVTSDWQLADPNIVRTFWGNVHEIGHNYQQSLWCDTFGTESSVNLFSLYAMEKMGVPPATVEEGMYTQAVQKIIRGKMKNFETDADVNDKLVFLVQLMDAVPAKSWKIYRDLFRAYRELSPKQQQALEDGPVGLRYDQHYELMSKITGMDLRGHYINWGIPLSKRVLDKVAQLRLPKPPMATWLIERTQ
ncbi:M60 family metallopeptidase [Iodobacter sp. CM08]|uniref:M60 family metallopeptidase n=1 Tax=Iodobacter sp. CM08 TaxID=3085902 RepID=UPI00298180C8|nr:M60 family metallopeptidase [Iodobacter sp. CM08]MDW5415783.1 M60 family metallopeptidase [Iodobacter sp. CM08]